MFELIESLSKLGAQAIPFCLCFPELGAVAVKFVSDKGEFIVLRHRALALG